MLDYGSMPEFPFSVCFHISQHVGSVPTVLSQLYRLWIRCFGTLARPRSTNAQRPFMRRFHSQRSKAASYLSCVSNRSRDDVRAKLGFRHDKHLEVDSAEQGLFQNTYE